MTSYGNMLLGPWGGEDGGEWSYTAEGGITQISITSDDDVLYSISFISDDKNGESKPSTVFGTPTGSPKEISIDASVEKLVLMEGLVGIYNSVEAVTQLSFTTSKNGVTAKHGPYGSKQKGTEFSCLLSEDPIVGFHGVCGQYLNSIGIMVKSRGIGPSWGGEGGISWSYATQGIISRISINYSDVIRAIRFTSTHTDGRLEHSKTFGDSYTEYNNHEIEIDTTKEKLQSISGTYGSYDDNTTAITSLAFTTNNRRTFGHFGKRKGTPFKYEVNKEEDIGGFYGRAGAMIDAIGVYKRPSIPSTNGVLVGPVGSTNGTKWLYQPKGLISHITITATTTLIYSISFESKDEQGNLDRSPIYGKEYGEKYDIDIDGKLNNIGGTIAQSGGDLFLHSLYFSTDKKIVYGHFGDSNNGAHFSIPVKDGFISGFHGTHRENNGYCLHSIGVYVNPKEPAQNGTT